MLRVAVLLAIFGCIATAHAEPNPDRDPPPVSTPSSSSVVVETVDGEEVRGVLIELAPNQHVAVRLPSGEERRFPWTMVRRIRSADAPVPAVRAPRTPLAGSAPVPLPPDPALLQPDPTLAVGGGSFDEVGRPLPVDASSVEVQVVGDDPRLTLRIRTGTRMVGTATSTRYVPATSTSPGRSYTTTTPMYAGTYEVVCAAPCAARFGVGLTYRFQVESPEYSNSGLPPRDHRVTIPSDAVGIRLHFNNRSRARRRAWWSVGVMPLIGLAVVGLAKVVPPGPTFGGELYDRNNGLFWMGVGLMCTPTVSYTVPLLMRDRTRVEVVRRRRSR